MAFIFLDSLSKVGVRIKARVARMTKIYLPFNLESEHKHKDIIVRTLPLGLYTITKDIPFVKFSLELSFSVSCFLIFNMYFEFENDTLLWCLVFLSLPNFGAKKYRADIAAQEYRANIGNNTYQMMRKRG